jgi:hypothetical protein
LIIAGHPDLNGLCLALSDWWAELRILEGAVNDTSDCRSAEVQKVARRLDKLDAIFNPFREQRRIKRWVVTVLGRPATLANTRCTRRLCSDGTLMELVWLDGTRDGLSDEDLERFIQSCPIEYTEAA